MTVGELLYHNRVRPELLHMGGVYEAAETEEASLMLGWLTAEGVGAASQILDTIRNERTFENSLREADYVDQMSAYLSDPDYSGPRRFILAGVSGLYVSPRLYAYYESSTAPQKPACSLLSLHGVAIAPHDWAAHRRSEKEDRRFFRASAFEMGLSPGDFRHFPLF